MASAPPRYGMGSAQFHFVCSDVFRPRLGIWGLGVGIRMEWQASTEQTPRRKKQRRQLALVGELFCSKFKTAELQ